MKWIVALLVAAVVSPAQSAQLKFTSPSKLVGELAFVKASFDILLSDVVEPLVKNGPTQKQVISFKIVSSKAGEALEAAIKQALHTVYRGGDVQLSEIKDVVGLTEATFEKSLEGLEWSEASTSDDFAQALAAALGTVGNRAFTARVETTSTYSNLTVLYSAKSNEVLIVGLENDI